jgi:hypothetical protein
MTVVERASDVVMSGRNPALKGGFRRRKTMMMNSLDVISRLVGCRSFPSVFESSGTCSPQDLEDGEKSRSDQADGRNHDALGLGFRSGTC